MLNIVQIIGEKMEEIKGTPHCTMCKKDLLPKEVKRDAEGKLVCIYCGSVVYVFPSSKKDEGSK